MQLGNWFSTSSKGLLGGFVLGTADRGAAKNIAAPARSGESAAAPPVAPADIAPDDLVGQMLSQGRYSILLRPQIVENLTEEQVQRATAALAWSTALMPEGDVYLTAWGVQDARCDEDEEPLREQLVHVDAFYLDRHTVTNARFQHFVDAGGYLDLTLWDQSVWPAVIELVDRSGCPGPRFWSLGKFPAGKEEHPVVGVCWFEAVAYARWIGKRLPSDPEWVKAASWPVVAKTGANIKPFQRKYPWGDTMDRQKACLWNVGENQSVPVTACADGLSVGGVQQMIGNVWEWTSNDFGSWDPPQRRLELAQPMKTIRGGAFDTYFDRQATTQFHSGDNAMARKHNIGFRCAIGKCDVAEG